MSYFLLLIFYPFLSLSSPHPPTCYVIVLAILISIITFVGIQFKSLPSHHGFIFSDAGWRFWTESHLLGARGDAWEKAADKNSKSINLHIHKS